ncbi:MAG: hypothetical protein RLY86_4276 [Pseudomonadota bacterium]|jgi:ferritin-like metal-binding protein YciE
MAQKGIKDLLLEELRDIYDAEKQGLKGMRKIMKKVSSETLRQAFETHAQQTEEQVERLKQAFEMLESRPRGKHCDAMEGLLSEAQSLLEDDLAPEVLDAALLAAQQKIEHYEIAAYGSAHAFAEGMGNTELANLLEQTLNEEKEADRLLSRIAIEDVNQRAMKAAA